MHFQLLIVDLTARSLLVVDGATNAILAELSLPAGEAITAIHAAPDGEKVFLPAAGNAGKGSLYVLNRKNLSLYRLPVAIAHPAWFTVCQSLACYADPAGKLYGLDLTALTVSEWQTPLTNGRCAGLIALQDTIYSLWETETCSLAAAMNSAGAVTCQMILPGPPTSLNAAPDGTAYATCLTGEVMQVIPLSKAKEGSPPSHVTLACPVCRQSLSGYPASLAIDSHALYILTDESCLTVIDKASGKTVSHTVLNRPLDSLHLLPGGRQAIGHSLLRGNLALIDLEAGRITAMTATDHRLGPVAVIPCEY